MKCLGHKIGFAGCGGIGSNVAWMLARSGIAAEFLLVDFDRVEEGNLNRQFFFVHQLGMPKVQALRDNLLSIHPGLTIGATCLRLGPDNIAAVFAGCRFVVEGLDQGESKKMLLEALSGPAGPEIVSACGIAGRDLAGLCTRKLGKLVVAGDFATDIADAPLFAHKVVAVAARMAACIVNAYGENP